MIPKPPNISIAVQTFHFPTSNVPAYIETYRILHCFVIIRFKNQLKRYHFINTLNYFNRKMVRITFKFVYFLDELTEKKECLFQFKINSFDGVRFSFE